MAFLVLFSSAISMVGGSLGYAAGVQRQSSKLRVLGVCLAIASPVALIGTLVVLGLSGA